MTGSTEFGTKKRPIYLRRSETGQFLPCFGDKKRTKQSSPKLYDLTTLQREANRLHHLPASRTLQLAQALYEKHKVITYPRTDSKALPEDYVSMCHDLLQRVSGDLQPFAHKALEENWINPNDKKVFNNKQISDHFAIIPTTSSPTKLDANEWKIYNLILKRFIAVFYPPADWDITTRTTEVCNILSKRRAKCSSIHLGYRFTERTRVVKIHCQHLDQTKSPNTWIPN